MKDKGFVVNKEVYERFYKDIQLDMMIKQIDKKYWRMLHKKLKQFYASFKSEEDEQEDHVVMTKKESQYLNAHKKYLRNKVYTRYQGIIPKNMYASFPND